MCKVSKFEKCTIGKMSIVHNPFEFFLYVYIFFEKSQ